MDAYNACSATINTHSEISPAPGLHHSIDLTSPLEGLPPDVAPVRQTLSFFELFTCPTITPPEGIDIFHGSLLAMCHQRDYFMHAVVGTAAAHLCTVDSISKDDVQMQRFRRTESYHWQQAICRYRAELTREVAHDHLDSLITTCMLLGMHSFYMPNQDGVR